VAEALREVSSDREVAEPFAAAAGDLRDPDGKTATCDIVVVALV
jgi:hypothetical protein